MFTPERLTRVVKPNERQLLSLKLPDLSQHLNNSEMSNIETYSNSKTLFALKEVSLFEYEELFENI